MCRTGRLTDTLVYDADKRLIPPHIGRRRNGSAIAHRRPRLELYPDAGLLAR